MNCVDRWYTHNTCPFLDTVFFDIVSTCGMSILQRSESKPALDAWTQLTSNIEVGSEYELAVATAPDSPLRAEALARLFVIDRTIVRSEALGTLVSQDYQSIGDALMLLSTEDPDTCCAALETLDTIIQKASSDSPTKPISLLMAHVHRIVLNASDAEVISKAQSVLADALDMETSRPEFFSLVTEPQLLDTLAKLEEQCLSGPPSNTQSALRLLGFFLDYTHHSLNTHDSTVLAATTRYIRLLRMTILDTNPFDTRFAAAESIRALHHLWTARTPALQPSPLVLGLGLILYDMLQDDDDEIRDAAAISTSTFLSLQTSDDVSTTVPILASQQLLHHLTTVFPSSTALATHALRRLTSTVPPTPLFQTPFASLLPTLTTPSTALFAQEKQNLFKDDILDLTSWSHTLSTPSLLSSLPPALLLAATTYTTTALTTLTAHFATNHDGALGWAGKPDVLTWLLRIVALADVVLCAPRVPGTEKAGVK
ncbi:hypothetical protein N0V94_004185, partial [Neodidymelliopsis sp. IMI 364377]